MSDYIGTREQEDEFIGSRFVEAAYKGSTKYYDAYSDVSGPLPLVYESRVEHTLKNYALYGSASGAGVETGNLFDKNDTSLQLPNCVFLSGSYTNSAATTYTSCFVIFIPITGGRTYTCSLSQNPSSGHITFASVFSINKPAYGTTYKINDTSTFVNHGITITEFTREAPVEANWMAVQIATADNLDNDIMIVEGSTAPSTYIPYGYKIPLTDMGENSQSETYPLYIGSTKLGEEEYVDYESGKVYKRTENLWEYELERGTTGGGQPHPADNRVRSILFPITANTYTFVFDNYENYNIAYDAWDIATHTLLDATAWLESNTFTLPENTNNLRLKIRRKDNANLTPAEIQNVMLVEGSTAPETYIPYLQPTDPPVPFPAITAYKGENTLSSTETVGTVTVKGRINELPTTP